MDIGLGIFNINPLLFGTSLGSLGTVLWGAGGTDWLQVAWNVFLVILGVNALIMVHELGHFLAARACGVRCDKFYLGIDIFGLSFFKFKWGDTEYGLGILPFIGGYVKMYGQEDNPGQIAKEIEKAKIAVAEQPGLQEPSQHNKGINKGVAIELAKQEQSGKKRQSGANQSVDANDKNPVPSSNELAQMEKMLYAKDSYLSKSIPQRMMIISAGVFMNIVFAWICASTAYMIGLHETPCSVGGISPGSPAWSANLQIGDQIVGANGTKVVRFQQLMDAIIDGAGTEEGVKLQIQRPNVEEPIEKQIIARKSKTAFVPTIGITNLCTLDLVPQSPFSSLLTQALKRDGEAGTLTQVVDLSGGAVLSEVNGQPVGDFADFVKIQYTHFDQPLLCQFKSQEEQGQAVSLSLPTIPMKELGIQFEMGEITAIKLGSAAEQAGIEVGDTLLSVDGATDFDPMKLPQQLLKRKLSGTDSVVLELKKKNGSTISHTLPLSANPERLLTLSPNDAVACNPLGIAYQIKNVIRSVDPEGKAAGLQITPGAVVESIEFPNYAPSGLAETSFIQLLKENVVSTVGFRITSLADRIDLPFIYENLFAMIPSGTKARLHTLVEGKPIVYDLELVDSTDWFEMERGLNFKPSSYLVRADSLGQAMELGFYKTVDATLMVYRFLKNIGRNVSARAMGGPITIVKVAYGSSSEGMGQFLLFLCLIGANLAVLNILPIPVLDGGHLVFLAYEGIFRRPPNEAVQVALSYLGLFLILALMFWVFALDLGFIPRM
ncbi:MAG: site-2 protease family protein [Thermoguttaceae bacterium]